MTTRRQFLTSTIAALTCAGIPSLAGQAEAQTRPNIILINADDLGWGDLSCYPQDPNYLDSVIRTPNIDSLAAEGVRCTQGYSTCAVCTPSRVALLTGRYQQSMGWYEFVEAEVGIPRNELLLPEFLKQQGYATALMGKWHAGFYEGSRPLDRGFDRFYGFWGGQHDYFDPRLGDPITAMSFDYDGFVRDQDEPVQQMEYLTDELTRKSIEFIEKQAFDRTPFFLYLAYNAPHPSMQAKWEKLEPYARARGGKFTSRDIARAMIDSMDEGIGLILQKLLHLGIDRNTLIIFTSDNGGQDDRESDRLVQHNGGLRPRKGFLWEGGIRVPFIVRFPGRIPEGITYTSPVSQLDIFATIGGAIDANPGKSLDGVNLLPHLSGETTAPPHDVLYWGFEKANDRWAIRKGRWKLAHDIIGYKAVHPDRVDMELGLYDLEADPGETKNLKDQFPEVVRELTQLKDKWYETLPPSIATPEVRAKWMAELKRRKEKLPNADSLRRDGAPGHWMGQ